MKSARPLPWSGDIALPTRQLAEQVFSRTAGAPLISGNAIRLLKDAEENYPAWLEALRSARKTIHFESYIIHEDEVGRRFGELLREKAREGVTVRLLYDWIGGLGKTSRHFWNWLREAGVEVRCFNPLHWDSPLGWVTRDHRKMIAVDGEVAFVTGLCLGRHWAGDPLRGIEPWRDTGVAIRGPALADIERTFGEVWATTGAPLPATEIPVRELIPPAGEVALRVIGTAPATAGLYRLDQLIGALARTTLWLTDAYFVGSTSYLQVLRAAAQDGVDVRLLVPGTTDIPILRGFSRAIYQPLLESGVRVFEWDGSMIHAKTAVADGRWARVGSSNLNMASWVGNYELDVAVEDESFARDMETMYLEDLSHCTEVVLSPRGKVRLSEARTERPVLEKTIASGSVGRAGVRAIGLGGTLGAAITNHRVLGPAEARVTGVAGLLILLIALAFALWPWWTALPLIGLCGWIGLALLLRTAKLLWKKKSPDPPPGPQNLTRPEEERRGGNG
ncbi:MAG: cardiolipin synthase B [Deltaproteobacteria bacterium]|nr:cardiolipin synthase B [Deltaproteobacteria bacterium]